MTLSELLTREYATPATGQIEIAGLTLDSRAVKPGFLFAALPGVKLHGSAFAPQAVAQGAVAILSDQAIAGLHVPVIIVDDAAAELAAMAARFYPRQPGHIVAITGTNGKSSTVEFLRQIWAAAGIDGASLARSVSRAALRSRPRVTRHPTRLPCTMRSTRSPLTASRIWRWRRPAMA